MTDMGHNFVKHDLCDIFSKVLKNMLAVLTILGLKFTLKVVFINKQLVPS